MATQTTNGITLIYPDDPCPVFNPCVFRLTGTMERAVVSVTKGGETYSASFNTPNGGLLDLRQFMQLMFDGIGFGQDLEQMGDIKVSDLAKNVTVTITVIGSGNTTLATFTPTIFCVWGCTEVGQVWLQKRTLTYYRGYPLTFGLYAPRAGEIVIDDGGSTDIIGSVSKGLYNIRVAPDSDIASIIFSYEVNDEAEMQTIADIKVEDVCDEGGIYLRWIDRHGFWCYRLFKAGDPTRTIASRYGMWNRNDLSKFYGIEGWHGSAGRRQSFTRNDVQPLCAPLVDSETFDQLQDLTASPVIDMFLGLDEHDEPKWTAVTVEAGQYTKDVKKTEQDFIFNLVLPESPVQQL